MGYTRVAACALQHARYSMRVTACSALQHLHRDFTSRPDAEGRSRGDNVLQALAKVDAPAVEGGELLVRVRVRVRVSDRGREGLGLGLGLGLGVGSGSGPGFTSSMRHRPSSASKTRLPGPAAEPRVPARRPSAVSSLGSATATPGSSK